jgi:hypothetical protein
VAVHGVDQDRDIFGWRELADAVAQVEHVAAPAAVGALWHAGLLGGSAPATLQASAGDVDQAIRQLDERIQSGAVPPPAGERGR